MKTESFEVRDIHIEKAEKFLEYISSDKLMQEFYDLLVSFLTKYFKTADPKPLTCEFKLFYFPGENYKDPMVKITYSDTEDFNNLMIRDEIEENFKHYLAEQSEKLEKFKAFRRIQRKFRFVVQRE